MNLYDANELAKAIRNTSKLKISKWEEDFLDSIEHQIDCSQKLTDRQSKKLEQVYRNSQGG